MDRPIDISVTYTRDILIRANRIHVFRSFGWKRWAFVVLLAAVFIGYLAAGERGWFLGVLGSGTAIAIMMPIAVYKTLVGRALRRLDRMASKTVEFHLTDESLSGTSDLGSGGIPWTQVEKLWRFPDFWILYYADNAYVILPTAELDDNVRAFIQQKAKSAGARIT